MQDTIRFIRHLPRYSILEHEDYTDPYIERIVNSRLDPMTIKSLKEYTRGCYDIDLHYEAFYKYYTTAAMNVKFSRAAEADPHITKAIIHVRRLLEPIGQIVPISKSRLDDVKWIPSAAAGYGYVGVKKDNYELARHNATRCFYDYARWRHNYRFVPDKAFARTQLAKRVKPKIRHVWGRAFHHILLEGLFLQPLITKLALNDTPIYIGRDIHLEMPAAIMRLTRDNHLTCCLDFTSFDATVCSYLITQAWTILETLFIFNADSEIAFDLIRDLNTNTPVIMPDGRLYEVTRGVPSGSYATQIIDSIVCLILISALQLKFFGHTVESYVMGDDSIFTFKEESLTLEQAANYFQTFGMTLSMDKSIITRHRSDVTFLGHNFYGSRVCRDEFTCLCLALFTETPTPDPESSALRIASLIYDSGYNSMVLFNIYKILLTTYHMDWSSHIRPLSILPPFTLLYYIS